jgi:hypothetical protein
MTFTIEDTLEILERTPAVLDGLMRGSTPAWHQVDEGPGSWSPFEVVGHLIHAEETDWIPRARLILASGESRAFEPFDRFAHLRRFEAWPLDRLLDRFAELRGESVQTLRGWELTAEQLSRPGLHPELGAVTLQQLLATWTVHDLGHIGQIVRVMARRYTDEVGAWRAYLSVLTR